MTVMTRGRMSRLERILRVEGGVDGGWRRWRMTSLQGSLRDEGTMAERLRRFRVRRNTYDLGFRLVVVLDWSERTRCDSGSAMDARVFWNAMEQVLTAHNSGRWRPSTSPKWG
ncbi:uncharacterized protein HKW66_Vig0240450 [Vigna angularis]|uniref:Uncharacterized protein n=1 Tax=Phaseolus angularis TaxID=3914 RepID=A0A8T0JHA9_PHAAN|nr:uncharacterized protein HKW66_Vig0240450 [Vigna angularis]